MNALINGHDKTMPIQLAVLHPLSNFLNPPLFNNWTTCICTLLALVETCSGEQKLEEYHRSLNRCPDSLGCVCVSQQCHRVDEDSLADVQHSQALGSATGLCAC